MATPQMATPQMAKLWREVEEAKKYVIALNNDLLHKKDEAWQNHLDLVDLLRNKTKDFVVEMESKTREHIRKTEILISTKESLIRSMELFDQNFEENHETLIKNMEKSIKDISNRFYLFNIHYQNWYIKAHQNMSQLTLGQYQLEKANQTFSLKTLSLTESLLTVTEKHVSCQFAPRGKHVSCQFPPIGKHVSCRFAPPIPKLNDTNRKINQNDYAIITGLLVNQKKQVLVCDYDTSELRVYNRNGKYLFTYKPKQGMIRPKDISPISSNVFCVIYEGGNLFFFEMGENTLKLLIQYKKKAEYVSLCAKSGNFLACDENCCIDLLDSKGEFVKTIIKLTTEICPGSNEFHKIRNAPFHDSFLVLNRSDKKLFCVDMNGQILFTVGNNTGEMIIKDFCSDQIGNIYLFTTRGINLLTHGSLEIKTLFAFSEQRLDRNVESFIRNNSLYLTACGKQNKIQIFSLDF